MTKRINGPYVTEAAHQGNGNYGCRVFDLATGKLLNKRLVRGKAAIAGAFRDMFRDMEKGYCAGSSEMSVRIRERMWADKNQGQYASYIANVLKDHR